MTLRHIRAGEALAIDPRQVQQSRDAFFWLFGPPVQENEQYGAVHVVHVRGPLEHHEDPCSDSYEAIVARVQCAVDEGAETIVLRFDSPGGVVAGLNECVERLKAMPVNLVGFVDEMCFSAAYAISCACSEVYLPPSAILGSIGVISTMVDVTKADKMMGIRYVTLTSGSRKADGHPHVPISDDAQRVEMARVEKLADQFFRQVARARKRAMGGTVAKRVETIRGYEAGLFLGEEAVSAGLADGVSGWDELLAQLQAGTPEPAVTQSKTERMPMAEFEKDLAARIADPKTPRAEAQRLSAALAAYKKSKKASEEEDDEESAKVNETDRSDEPDKDEDDEDEDEKKSSKKSAGSKRKERMTDKSEEEAEALVALVQRATGKTGVAAQGALAALFADRKSMAERLEALEAARTADARDAVVNEALAKNRITKSEAKTLRTKPQAYVEAFLEARPKSLVWTDESEMPKPASNAGGSAKLTPELEQQIQQAIAATGLSREQIVAGFQKETSSLNGKGGVQ